MQYLEHEIEEQKCDTYFKFENGNVTKMDHPKDYEDETPICIYLPIVTINHITNTQDTGGIYYEHDMMPTIIIDQPLFLDYDINSDSLYQEAYWETRVKGFNQYLFEATSLPKLYNAVYPAMLRVKMNRIENGFELQNGFRSEMNDQTLWSSNGKGRK